jgi:hypothetical protein
MEWLKAGFLILFALFLFVYNYVRGIDYMKENHPDYDEKDIYGEDEWDTYSDLPNPKAYEKKDK